MSISKQIHQILWKNQEYTYITAHESSKQNTQTCTVIRKVFKNDTLQLLSAGNGTIAEFTGLGSHGAEALLRLSDTKAIWAQVHLQDCEIPAADKFGCIVRIAKKQQQHITALVQQHVATIFKNQTLDGPRAKRSKQEMSSWKKK